jgi:hypothetical protein
VCAVAIVLATVSVAGAQPISVDVNGSVRDLATHLSTVTSCRVVAMGNESVNVKMANVSLWDVLAKTEAQHGIRSTIDMGMIRLESGTAQRPNRIGAALSWTKDWQRFKAFAVGYAPGSRWGASGERIARLLVLNTEHYSIEKVVFDSATADGAKISPSHTVDAASRPCEAATIELKLPVAATVTKVSLRGHVIARIAATVERRVAVPMNDDVVDLKEGRLRIHIASEPAGAGHRKVYVGWDSLGESMAPIKVELVDDKGAPLSSGSQGSSRGGGQGRETRKVAWNGMGTIYAVIKIPKPGTGTEYKLPFKFDNVPIDP